MSALVSYDLVNNIGSITIDHPPINAMSQAVRQGLWGMIEQFVADTVGIKNVYDGICKYRDRYGDQYWTPAPLLEQLLSTDKTFSEWSATK